jgi:hypothetical protein
VVSSSHSSISEECFSVKRSNYSSTFRFRALNSFFFPLPEAQGVNAMNPFHLIIGKGEDSLLGVFTFFFFFFF